MLSWGRHYVMVEPEHFRVDYAINPFMDLAEQPDPALARHEWATLRSTLERHGARVDVVEQRPDSPDMVYAMNLGLGIVRPAGPHVVMSHMRFGQRRMESASAQPWFAEHGFTTSYVGRDGVGAHFEAGDAFPWGGELLVGYGPRTEELALKHLATDLGVAVRGFRLVHPAMYHFDLAFCPLDERRAIVCSLGPGRRLGVGPAGPGSRAAGPDRGGGARDLRHQLGRGRLDRGHARVPRPGPRAARGLGLHRRARRRDRVPQGRRLDPLPDQPDGHHPRPRPDARPRRAVTLPPVEPPSVAGDVGGAAAGRSCDPSSWFSLGGGRNCVRTNVHAGRSLFQ